MKKTMIISVLNHKGGTGKTTTTLNLGKALSLKHKRVLIIDIDAQANLSQYLGIENPERSIYDVFLEGCSLPILFVSPNFYLVPSTLDLAGVEAKMYANIQNYFRLKRSIEQVKDDYEFIFIDCPPSLGILTQNALIASNYVLITVQAHYFSLKGLTTIYEVVRETKKELNPDLEILGLLVTQTNHTNISRNISRSLKQSFPDKVFETNIRQNVSLTESSALNKDIFSYQPKSYGAEDYFKLANEILS